MNFDNHASTVAASRARIRATRQLPGSRPVDSLMKVHVLTDAQKDQARASSARARRGRSRKKAAVSLAPVNLD